MAITEDIRLRSIPVVLAVGFLASALVCYGRLNAEAEDSQDSRITSAETASRSLDTAQLDFIKVSWSGG
jgi:hypothetical protein